MDVYDQTSVENAIKGADVIVSSLGSGGLSDASKPTKLYSESTKNILNASRRLKIERVIMISSGGVEHDEGSPWYYRKLLKPYLINTYMDMMKMETLVENSNLKWTIVRPTYLLDGRSENFFASEKIIGEGKFKINRIDLAKFIIHEIENEIWVHKYPTLSY